MKNLIMIIIPTLGIIVIGQHRSTAGYIPGNTASKYSTGLEPDVELELSINKVSVSWGTQIRYSIHVRDQVDGNSRYNEIDPDEVFLNIRFFPDARDSADLALNREALRLADATGLTLMGRGSCFGCHADKTSMTGPSFWEIAGAFKNGARSKKDLANSIRTGSSGKWGNMEMPPHPEYSKEEAIQMVEFILKQGACEYCRVYPGLEGVFSIMDKPDEADDAGIYLLTAGYTSSNGSHGTDSIMLNIK